MIVSHDDKDTKGRWCRNHSSILNTLVSVGIEWEAEQNVTFQRREAEENTAVAEPSCSNCWLARNYRKVALTIDVMDLQLLKSYLRF